jgi:hypothetical protein
MGRILTGKPGNLRRSELTETTLIGRHWQCNVVLSSAEVPLYWLEVRWISDHWSWRCLGSSEKTKGAGKSDESGWRVWRTGLAAPPVISLPGGITVELVDPSPPIFHLQDQYTGEQFYGEALLDLVELTERGYILQGENVEEIQIQAILLDGSLLQAKGRVLRVWSPSGWQPTISPTVSLSSGGVFLTIDKEELIATITQHDAEITITGSPVRLLLTYADVAVNGPRNDKSKFLSTEEAYALWLNHGGRSDSKPKRLAWERGKLRSLLVQAGVVGVEELFTRRREGSAWRHSLNIQPARITIL